MNYKFDIFIIGGGINGAGIARDAAGRNLKVCLVDKGNVGCATSSWSTKLIHGGLRYLENFEFSLVRESLIEREVLNNIANSIVETIPFIIPYNKQMRPSWMIHLGLLLYDNLGGKSSFKKSSAINLENEYSGILKKKYKKAFKYYDLKVDDRKLVELNIIDAKKKGAAIYENTMINEVSRSKHFWNIKLNNDKNIQSKVLINASGPWVNEVLKNLICLSPTKNLRLVKGSHLITRKLHNYETAFTLQNNDNRIIFVIPYKKKFSLIGTTEEKTSLTDNPKINQNEIDYLIKGVNNYFNNQIKDKDIIDTYSGIRPLIEDFNKDNSKISRDYLFDFNNDDNCAALVNIYGGKITTYRKLANSVLEKLKNNIEIYKGNWTDKEKLF